MKQSFYSRLAALLLPALAFLCTALSVQAQDDSTIRGELDPDTGYNSHPSVSSGPYVMTDYDYKTAHFVINDYYKGSWFYNTLPADFRFGDGAEVTGNAGPLNGEAARCFTVRQGERQTDVLLISREMANRLFLLRDGSLIFTGAALLEDELGRLRLETAEPDNILQCWPPERLGASGKWMRMPDRGPLGEWRMDTAKTELQVAVRQTARHKYVFSLPELPENLKDVRLRICYAGDIGMLFLDNTMISDNFCNGDTWEIGLREHREALKTGRLSLTIAPVREGAVVSTESAMAARSEQSRQETGKLISAALQPVYEIVI